ncbi:hypothetical protein HII36_31035 [Nonomuraea sp. NN258]|uniref:hypothetical protein n=1 Tax=Nonomuraea antri TaxID=2730852 RepID=UPI001567D1D2|nr:hypothetical protein [Nonomuraea antri]NRQ36238.1 hypothetical protein [Nonomuraea antri]
MDWLPLVSTVAGAVIALGGTMLADTLRRRDERGRGLRTDRRQSYLDYVLALDTAHGLLRGVAARGGEPAELRRAAGETIGQANLYKTRENHLVTAAPEVAQAGEVAFRKLIAIRDVVRSGAEPGTKEFHGAYHDFAEALWRLRMSVRVDLGSRALKPGELQQASWSERESCDLCDPAVS